MWTFYILGLVIVFASIALGFLLMWGLNLTDGPPPRGWALWGPIWPAYVGIAVGLCLVSSHWWF